MTERVRFSASPTGPLSLGSARTALFGWLVARKSGGSFVLRIDDIGRPAAASESEAALLDDLHWLGLDWDEGPLVGGPHPPYRQSGRVEHYERALLALRRSGAVYPCFCELEEISAQLDEHFDTARTPRCRGSCRSLTEEERSRRIAEGEEASWLFATMPGRSIEWTDRVQGRTTISSDDIGDFPVVCADGTALDDLACVTDDSAMRITLVLQAEDRIASAPRRLLLSEALGIRPPAFGHLPIATGIEGAPLSESGAGESIRDLREAGFLPDAVVDYLARLGWSDPLERPALAREELLAAFHLSRVSTSAPRHDPARLRAINGRHMRALSAADLAAVLEPHVPPFPAWLDPAAFAEAVRPRIDVASDACALAVGLIAPEPADDEARGALREPEAVLAFEAAAAVLAEPGPFDGNDAAAALRGRLANHADPERALSAVSAALSGVPHGLPLATLFSLLGRDASVARIGEALRSGTIDTAERGNG